MTKTHSGRFSADFLPKPILVGFLNGVATTFFSGKLARSLASR